MAGKHDGTITQKTAFERRTGISEDELGPGGVWLGRSWEEDDTPIGSALVAELRGEQS